MKLSDVGDPRRGDAAAPLRDAQGLISLGALTLVVLGVRRGDLAPTRFAHLVVAAGAEAGLDVRVHSLRRGDGPPEPDAPTRGQAYLDAGASAYVGARVPAQADIVDAQLMAWAGSLASTQGPRVLCVALGADFAARAQASVVVALTAGLPLVAFSPAARSVASRIDLQLTEPRALVARGLVHRLSALP